MSAEDYHRAARLAPITGETLPAGRELLSEEIATLIQNCIEDCSPLGIRDAAIISILFGSGLRREEITKLNLDDYDSEDAKLVVRGKRSKQRIAYLGDGAVAALTGWLQIRGDDTGPLFFSVKRGGHLRDGRRLSPQSIYYLLKTRAERAGVKPFTPHDLRRSFVSRLLEAGVDIAIVAKMAGHSNIQTTARYDRRPEEAKKRAASLLRIPYFEHVSELKSIKEARSRYYPICCSKSAFSPSERCISRLLKSRYGWDDLPDNVLQALGNETIKIAREFNRRAGFTKEDYDLPEWVTEQAIPETLSSMRSNRVEGLRVQF
jgi:hypothetical protein